MDKKGREMFSTNTPTLGLPRGVQKLDVRVAKTNRITSALNASLQIESTSFTYLRGSEGTHMEGKQFLWKADQDINLKVYSVPFCFHQPSLLKIFISHKVIIYVILILTEC